MSPLESRIAAAKREIRSRSWDGVERKFVPANVRSDPADGGDFQVTGHAAVFDDLSEDLGFFEPWFERIEPGAFASVLRKNPDVRALFNHDPNMVLARHKVTGPVGWLKLVEDAQGLRYDFVPTRTTYAGDLRANIDAGVVDQSSFAFRVARKGDSWEEDDEGRLVRTIHQFSDLYDVSPVTYPAYATTSVGLAAQQSPRSRVSATDAHGRGTMAHGDDGRVEGEQFPLRAALSRTLERQGRLVA